LAESEKIAGKHKEDIKNKRKRRFDGRQGELRMSSVNVTYVCVKGLGRFEAENSTESQ
jgi:macrodomain Ter protein organizer (MatP/YcbG family)